MYHVEIYVRVRRACMVEGMSVREASRVFGLHRDTVRKMLAYSAPPGYRRQDPPRRPRLEPFTGVAPVAFGHRDVLVKGYVAEVVISCGAEVIARHPRSYERDDFVFDPSHYLPLLEQKTAALDQAAPLQGWQLPEEFATLRRLLESRMGRRGKREFVQVLRLLENFSHQEVHHAVQDALRLGAISFDAVKHLLLCHLEGRPPRLDLDLYPYLPRVSVKTTSATDYLALLPGRAA